MSEEQKQEQVSQDLKKRRKVMNIILFVVLALVAARFFVQYQDIRAAHLDRLQKAEAYKEAEKKKKEAAERNNILSSEHQQSLQRAVDKADEANEGLVLEAP